MTLLVNFLFALLSNVIRTLFLSVYLYFSILGTCILLRDNIFKILTWGGLISDIRSEITFSRRRVRGALKHDFRASI